MSCYICKEQKDDVHFQITIDKSKSDMLENLVLYTCKKCLKQVMEKYSDTGTIDIRIDKDGQLHFMIDD